MKIPVSVIIPVYNKERYLRKTINSILNQTFQPNEIIIVDDCSFDGSVKIIKKLKNSFSEIKLIELKSNFGVSHARNIGAKYATNELITFLDADDYYANPQKLENEYKLYRNYEDEKIGCCIYSKIVVVDMNEKRVRTSPPNKRYLQGNILENLLEWVDFSIVPRDFIVSKNEFMNVGGYNEKRSQYEDLELLLSLAKNNMFYCTFQDGTAYRQTGVGLSEDRNGSLKINFDEVIKNSLDELPSKRRKNIAFKRNIRRKCMKIYKKMRIAVKKIKG